MLKIKIIKPMNHKLINKNRWCTFKLHCIRKSAKWS